MPRLLRWPEKLNVDAEEAGSRGEHEGARREMANSMVVLAFAGEAPVVGEARTGRVRAAVNSGEDAPDEILLDTKEKKVQGEAPQHGEDREQGMGGGDALERPESTKRGGG